MRIKTVGLGVLLVAVMVGGLVERPSHAVQPASVVPEMIPHALPSSWKKLSSQYQMTFGEWMFPHVVFLADTEAKDAFFSETPRTIVEQVDVDHPEELTWSANWRSLPISVGTTTMQENAGQTRGRDELILIRAGIEAVADSFHSSRRTGIRWLSIGWSRPQENRRDGNEHQRRPRWRCDLLGRTIDIQPEVRDIKQREEKPWSKPQLQSKLGVAQVVVPRLEDIGDRETLDRSGWFQRDYAYYGCRSLFGEIALKTLDESGWFKITTTQREEKPWSKPQLQSKLGVAQVVVPRLEDIGSSLLHSTHHTPRMLYWKGWACTLATDQSIVGGAITYECESRFGERRVVESKATSPVNILWERMPTPLGPDTARREYFTGPSPTGVAERWAQSRDVGRRMEMLLVQLKGHLGIRHLSAPHEQVRPEHEWVCGEMTDHRAVDGPITLWCSSVYGERATLDFTPWETSLVPLARQDVSKPLDRNPAALHASVVYVEAVDPERKLGQVVRQLVMATPRVTSGWKQHTVYTDAWTRIAPDLNGNTSSPAYVGMRHRHIQKSWNSIAPNRAIWIDR